MIIEKKGKVYEVKENSKTWTVSLLNDSGVTATAKILKSDCPSFEDLKAFVAENDLF